MKEGAFVDEAINNSHFLMACYIFGTNESPRALIETTTSRRRDHRRPPRGVPKVCRQRVFAGGKRTSRGAERRGKWNLLLERAVEGLAASAGDVQRADSVDFSKNAGSRIRAVRRFRFPGVEILLGERGESFPKAARVFNCSVPRSGRDRGGRAALQTRVDERIECELPLRNGSLVGKRILMVVFWTVPHFKCIFHYLDKSRNLYVIDILPARS